MLDAEAEASVPEASVDDAPPENASDPAVTIELLLAQEHLQALARTPGIVRAGPSHPVQLVWYDDPDQSIALQKLSLCRSGSVWQLELLEPDGEHDWPACRPPLPIDRQSDPAQLSVPIPFDIAPVGAFAGRARSYVADDVAIAVRHGELRGVLETRPSCRLGLTGPVASIARLLPSLHALALSVPRSSLAREAVAASRGTALPARHLGAPALGGDVSVGDGLAAIIGHLLDALLFWTDAFRRDRPPEAVHQARVATRRLRSALSIYRSVAECPELAALMAAAKQCAATLGAARDWDVFLAVAGAHLAQATGGDPRIATLLRAAARQREAAYGALADYLASPEFRHFELSLGLAAALRPWASIDSGASATALQQPTLPFAAAVLTKRLKSVRHRGRQLEALPTEALHELRKDCKRLRYAAEFFAPAFSAKQAKPFLRRLSEVQEELGALNDMAASGLLMTQLGRPGCGYAGGVVHGMAVSGALPARSRIRKSWKSFKRADPFWK